MPRIDTSQAPYYDITSEEKNYYQVLFGPGRPIQARELTEIQSNFRNQLDKGFKYFLSQGDVVIPGDLKFLNKVSSANVVSYSGQDTLDAFEGNLIFTGETSGATGKVIHTDGGNIFFTSESGGKYVYLTHTSSLSHTPTSGDYVSGANSAANATVVSYSSSTKTIKASLNSSKGFNPGELVTNSYTSGSQTFTLDRQKDYTDKNTFIGETISNSSSSIVISNVTKGSLARVDEGYYYVDGIFAHVDAQTITLESDSVSPSYRIGFDVSHSIVTANDDETLLDQSQGFSNDLAPGADRAKITLTLAKRFLDSDDTDDFIEILRVREGQIVRKAKTQDEPVLSSTLAKRTFEESGNYTVKNFDLSLREHDARLKDSYGRNGVYETGGLESSFVAEVGNGLSYVKGNRIDKTEEKNFVSISKARETATEEDVNLDVRIGNYIYASGMYGLPEINIKGQTAQDAFPTVDLYNDDVFTFVSSGAKLGEMNVDGNNRILKLNSNMTKLENDVLNGGVIILTNTNGYSESRIITDYDANTRKVKIQKPFSSSKFPAASANLFAYDLIGARPTLDDDLEDVRLSGGSEANVFSDILERFKAKRIGSARVRDVVFEEGIPGANGIYRVYLFDIQMDAGYTFEQSKSFMSKVTSPQKRNKPDFFRGNILSEIAFDAWNGVPFQKIRWQPITINDYARSLYGEIRCTKTNGSGDTIKALVHKFDPVKKTIWIQNASGLSVYSDKKSTTISVGDAIEQTNSFGVLTGAYAEVVGKKVLHEAEYNKAFFELPEKNVKIVSGVNISLGRRFVTGEFQGGTCVISLGGSEEFQTQQNASAYDATYIGSLTNRVTGDIGIVGNSWGLNISATTSQITLSEGTSGQIPDGTKVVLAVPVNKTPARLKYKNISGNVLEFVSTKDKVQRDEIVLSKTDGYELVKVEMTLSGSFGDTSFNTSSVVDITDSYEFDGGQRDNFYDRARLILKPSALLPTNPIRVTYRHFSHTDGDYFSVNSYKGLAYKDIPKYTSKNSGKTVRLSDVIDIRPSKDSGGNFVPSLGASTPEIISKAGSIEITSYEYYLNRIDKLYLSDEGTFKTVTGVSSIFPQVPDDPDTGMVTHVLSIPAFTYAVKDITVSTVENRRYTMKDIGKLEKRIERVEYYTALNELEKATADLRITDNYGLERFKNGFVVDTFKGHGVGNVTHPDYNCCIDEIRGELLPRHDEKAVDFDFHEGETTSSQVQKTSNVVTLAYSETPIITNNVASNIVSVVSLNGAGLSRRGEVRLDPAFDYFYSWNDAIEVVSQTEGNGFDDLKQVSNKTMRRRLPEAFSGYDETTENGLEYSESLGGVRESSQSSQTFDGGFNQEGKLYSSAYKPYLRERRQIKFFAKGLKPETTFKVFFDGNDVSDFCFAQSSQSWWENQSIPSTKKNVIISWASLEISSNVNNSQGIIPAWFLTPDVITKVEVLDAAGTVKATARLVSWNAPRKELLVTDAIGEWDTYINRRLRATHVDGYTIDFPIVNMGVPVSYETFGESLRSDSEGNLNGVFYYWPSYWKNNSTLLKKVNPVSIGPKQFLLTSSSNYEFSLADSYALVNYHAGTRPSIVDGDITSLEPVNGFESETNIFVEPLAQTFIHELSGGAFLTSVDLFFYQKDVSQGVSVEIREVENGKITQNAVPGSYVFKSASSVSASSVSKTPSRFTFEYPVYLRQNIEYALVVMSESDRYVLYSSKGGLRDLFSGTLISPKANLGTLYKAHNPSQGVQATLDEDLTLVFNRAEFVTPSNGAIAFFGNKDALREELPASPFFTTNNSSRIYVSHPSHGMYEGYEVTFEGVSSNVNGLESALFTGNTFAISSPGTDYYWIETPGGEVANKSGYSGPLAASNALRVTANTSAKFDECYFSSQQLVLPDTSIEWTLRTLPWNTSQTSSMDKRVEANSRIPFESTRVVSDAGNIDNVYGTVETVASTGRGAILFSKLRSAVSHLSPMIHTGRLGLVTVANRVNNLSSPDWTNSFEEEIDVKISNTDAFADTIAIEGNTRYVSADVSFDKEYFPRIVTLDLNTSNLVSTWIEGDTGTLYNQAGNTFGTFEILHWNINTKELSIKTFENTWNPSIATNFALDQVNVVSNASMQIGIAGWDSEGYFRANVITTTANADFTSYFRVNDLVNISTNGSKRTNLEQVTVANVQSSFFHVYLSEDAATEFSDSTSLESGTTTIINTTKDNYLWTANTAAKTILRSIQPGKFIRLTSDDVNYPSTNLDANGFKVIRNENGNVIVNAYLTTAPAGNSMSISQLNNYVSEDYARSTSSQSAYVTKQITLKEPADSLKTILRALIPYGAGVGVYYKTIRPNSSETFDSISWKPFNPEKDARNTKPEDVFSQPDNVVISGTGEFREYVYTVSNVENFIGFAIKIVMRSTDTSKVPRIKDLRVIATSL